jgi:two-component system phosphate regulon response regulator PhoB
LHQRQLHEADNGDNGLLMAQRVQPDLMLLDVMMPGSLDGLQVCQKLKTDPRYENIRIVLLTARGQKSDIEAGERAGANAYLTKPFSPLELLDRIEQLLSEAPAATH